MFDILCMKNAGGVPLIPGDRRCFCFFRFEISAALKIIAGARMLARKNHAQWLHEQVFNDIIGKILGEKRSLL